MVGLTKMGEEYRKKVLRRIDSMRLNVAGRYINNLQTDTSGHRHKAAWREDYSDEEEMWFIGPGIVRAHKNVYKVLYEDEVDKLFHLFNEIFSYDGDDIDHIEMMIYEVLAKISDFKHRIIKLPMDEGTKIILLPDELNMAFSGLLAKKIALQNRTINELKSKCGGR